MSREKLKALEELQQVDLKIRDLSTEAEKHPALEELESLDVTSLTPVEALRHE